MHVFSSFYERSSFVHFARDTVLCTVGCKKIQVFSAKVHLWLIIPKGHENMRARKRLVFFGPESQLCMQFGFTQSSETECNGAVIYY